MSEEIICSNCNKEPAINECPKCNKQYCLMCSSPKSTGSGVKDTLHLTSNRPICSSKLTPL